MHCLIILVKYFCIDKDALFVFRSSLDVFIFDKCFRRHNQTTASIASIFHQTKQDKDKEDKDEDKKIGIKIGR